jgi:Mycothiol maleylpyruvate isomerase N-terminal domain
MPGTDRRPALYASCQPAAQIAGNVSADELGRPTPRPAYTVSDLVDHLVGAAARAASLGRGEPQPSDAFPHVQLADAAQLLLQSGKEAEAAWADDERLEATVPMP